MLKLILKVVVHLFIYLTNTCLTPTVPPAPRNVCGGRNRPCLPGIYDLKFASGRQMNPKLPSHVIESRKYLLQVCRVLGTGNTKLNEMQWKSQFSGETDQGKQAALLRWAQVCNTEMCTLWTQCGETQKGNVVHSTRRSQESLLRRGHPVHDVMSDQEFASWTWWWARYQAKEVGQGGGMVHLEKASDRHIWSLGCRWTAQQGEARQGGQGSHAGLGAPCQGAWL